MLVKIELNEQAAKEYRDFMRYRKAFNLMYERGVFDVKNGSAILDFDKNSNLRCIRFTGYLYSEKHETKDFVEPEAFYTI